MPKDNPIIGETIEDVIYGNPMVIIFKSGNRVEYEFCNIGGENTALQKFIKKEETND